MGATSFSGSRSISDASYKELYATRLASHGVKAFTHTDDISSGRKSAAVHERVDPAAIAKSLTGKRESRDVNGTDNSNAIVVFFDVTGSMGAAPRVLQEKLAKLMSSVLTKGVIDDPQILFGAVGDATCDRVPFQVGQFETDLAMDEDLDKFFLEGGGGGGNHESYELALFFLSRLTAIDCLEKRGKRGIAFIIADEAAYTKASKDQIKALFGDDFGLQEDIPIETLAKEVSKKYETFIILPTKASGYGTQNKPFWNELFPQKVLELDDIDLVCELIVTTIGISEGVIDSVDDVADSLDMDGEARTSVSTALAHYTGGKGRDLATVMAGDLVTSEGLDDLDV